MEIKASDYVWLARLKAVLLQRYGNFLQFHQDGGDWNRKRTFLIHKQSAELPVKNWQSVKFLCIKNRVSQKPAMVKIGPFVFSSIGFLPDAVKISKLCSSP